MILASTIEFSGMSDIVVLPEILYIDIVLWGEIPNCQGQTINVFYVGRI